MNHINYKGRYKIAWWWSNYFQHDTEVTRDRYDKKAHLIRRHKTNPPALDQKRKLIGID